MLSLVLTMLLGIGVHAADTVGSQLQVDALWESATGGRIVHKTTEKGREEELLDSQGHVLAINRYSTDGRLVETLSGPALGSHGAGAWETQVLYADPVTGRPFTRRWRSEPRGPARQELSLAHGVQKTRTWNGHGYDEHLQELALLPSSDHIDDGGSCQPDPGVLAANPNLGALFGSLGPNASGSVTLRDGDGHTRTYDRYPFGLVDRSCGQPGGGLTGDGLLQRAMLNALRNGVSCLARQGSLGVSMAAQLAGTIRQGGTSGTRGATRPFRIQCENNACAVYYAQGTVPGDRDFPRVKLNLSQMTRMRESDGAMLPDTLLHELLHNNGVLHGSSIDYCYAVQTCCFPHASASAGAQAGPARDAACAILNTPPTASISDPAYLRQIALVVSSQDRPHHAAMLIGGALMRVPAADRPQQWPAIVAILIENELRMGNSAYAQALASAELGVIPADSSARASLQQLLTQAQAQTADPQDQATAQLMAQTLILTQQGRQSELEQLISSNGPQWDHIRELQSQPPESRQFRQGRSWYYLGEDLLTAARDGSHNPTVHAALQNAVAALSPEMTAAASHQACGR